MNTKILEDLPDSVDLKHYLILEVSRICQRLPREHWGIAWGRGYDLSMIGRPSLSRKKPEKSSARIKH
jgi:hypothetical protein